MSVLIFDVESVADPAAARFLEPLEPPANYRKPEAIDAWLDKAKADQLATAALDPDLCRIVAFGRLLMPEEGELFVDTASTEGQEYDLLVAFWSHWRHELTTQRIGYNCLGFDLPVLIRRSQLLGVRHPHISLNKYKSVDCTDLMNVLSFEGARKYRSLHFYAKRFGLDLPADEGSGKDVAAWAAAGEWEKIRTHCAADVSLTWALAQRIGVVKDGVL